VLGPGYGVHANAAHGKLFDANLHNVTMHMCEIDGDVAHAESYSLGMFLDKGGETGRVLAGRYIDRLERRDGEWRIVLRRSTVEIALEGRLLCPQVRHCRVRPISGATVIAAIRPIERPLSAESGDRW